MKRREGFTVVEITVLVVIVAALSTLVVIGFNRTLTNSRNDAAKAKVTLMAGALRKYYSANGEYPTCAQLVPPKTPQDVSALLQGIDPNTVTRQGAAAGTNSLYCGAANTTGFAYSTTGSAFTLSFQEESTGTVVTVTN